MKISIFCILFLLNSCHGVVQKDNRSDICSQTRFENLDSALLHKNCVITLKLRESGLKKFPKEVVEFPNLKYLDLAMNDFDTVPDEIGQLTHLTDFITAYSSVKYISPAIGNLKKLRNINMIDNNLTYLPDSICALPALEMLILKGNKITHLPQNIHHLTALKYLAVLDDEGNPTLTKNERERIKNLLGHCEGKW
jgi:Leucine-rich repeat (LRR) protein